MNRPVNPPVLPVTLLPGRIRVFPFLPEARQEHATPGHVVAFLTLGAGETHLTVLDGDGKWTRGWTAVFGWSVLCALPVETGGVSLGLDEESMVARALHGRIHVHGQIIETSTFCTAGRQLIRSGIGQILDRTIGDGADCDRIVLSGPVWLHGLLGACLDLRPHIHPDIKTT